MPEYIEDARVSITDDAGNEEVLNYISDGVYLSNSTIGQEMLYGFTVDITKSAQVIVFLFPG